MKKDDYLSDLHIGRMIQELARQKKMPSKKFTNAFSPVRYEQNAEKIFKLSDFEVEDVMRASKILEFNLLEHISETYLSHIPFTGSCLEQVYNSITLDFSTKRFILNITENPEKIHIGQFIKQLAHNKGLAGREIAYKMKCDQSLVSYYYNHETMRIKHLIQFSNALNYNLIAEIYLVRMGIIPCKHHFNDCMIRLNTQQDHVNLQTEGTFTVTFCPKK